MKYFLINIFMTCFLSLSGQILFEGSVVDKENNQPIEEVHIFLVGTEYGTTSNAAGKFVFSLEQGGSYELGITHINYEPIFINLTIEDGDSRIFQLSPTIQQIEEIEVTAKKSNKRDRYLNRFRRALLGQSPFAKNCVFENPEVLLFKSSEGGGFKAMTLDLLRINNPDLGYTVNIFLEYFEANGLTTAFGTKAFFQQNAEPTDELFENRRIAHAGSRRHFFEALAQDRLREEGFVINHAAIDGDDLELKQIAKRKDILIENNDKKVLTLNNPLAVYFQPSKLKNFPNSEDRVSYLIPKVSIIDITNPASIAPNQLVEMGYWNRTGVANWLPVGYSFTPHSVDAEKMNEIATLNGFSLANLLIPLEAIQRGGPPKDGIPAIDQPIFTERKKAKFIADSDRVIGIDYNGIQRAYPIRILDRHEIVNDRYGSVDIIISYCPLCNSGMAFYGKIGQRNYSFGVSGLLYNSDVLMYDRQTESLWSQIQGEAISGAAAGNKIEYIPVENTTMEDWMNRFPNSQVMTVDKSLRSRYESPAYEAYRYSDRLMFPVSHEDNTLKNKDLIFGITVDGTSKAYPFKLLAQKPVLEDKINGQSFTIIFDNNHQKVTVSDTDDKTILGHTMYWFAWKTFYPKTEVYGNEEVNE